MQCPGQAPHALLSAKCEPLMKSSLMIWPAKATHDPQPYAPPGDICRPECILMQIMYTRHSGQLATYSVGHDLQVMKTGPDSPSPSRNGKQQIVPMSALIISLDKKSWQRYCPYRLLIDSWKILTRLI